MTSKFQDAAQELLNRRAPGTKAPRLNAEYRPHSIDDALNIQSSMIDLRSDKVGGWKCLLPLAEDKYVVAPIFADTIQRGEQCELFADNNVARVEPEIAFILSKALPSRAEGYSEQEVNDAIGSCHMALELMQARFAEDSDAEFYERLADCLVNQGMFIGPEIDKQQAFAASEVKVTVTQQDQVQQFDGKHPNQQPASPIYWLINYMTRRGVSFEAGEALITGSYCGIVEVDFDKPTTINYADIGEYQVTFSRK